MDVFRFLNPNDPMKMEQGVFVQGLKSKTWIERYGPAGEFKFIADVRSGAQEALPLGSFVSHIDTPEIMVVENHEINEKKNQESEITISGRGFETETEQRVIGSNQAFPSSGSANDYVIGVGYLSAQITELINNHILPIHLIDDNDELQFVTVVNEVGDVGEQVGRSLKRGPLYDRVQELLAIQKLGIRVFRPGSWSPLGAGDVNTAVVIHMGTDRTGSIIFSNDTGEIENADYVWSTKLRKNAALITGRWVSTRVVGPEVKRNRRWMDIDASDLDNNFNDAPYGVDLMALVSVMQQRGLSALASQNDVSISRVEVAKNATKAAYRKDFNVGDLISVHGSYNTSSVRRISEYAEIEDQTGFTGQPTLEEV